MDNNTIPTIVHDDDESIFQKKKFLKLSLKILLCNYSGS